MKATDTRARAATSSGESEERLPSDATVVAAAAREAKVQLRRRHGDAHGARIDRGVDQVAALWRDEDGDLRAFALEHFIADAGELDATFMRLEQQIEQLDGYLAALVRELRRPADLDVGPLLRVDPLFAAYNPGAHTADDLFRTQIAFVALLNFPQATLAEKLAHGDSCSRREWAERRLTDRFAMRVPAAVQQQVTAALADADVYISTYNIWMHHLVDEAGVRAFPKGLRFIAHWNLRDELKAQYADRADGLARQRLIAAVMTRIVEQTIPQAVIDNSRLDWNPIAGTVAAAPADAVEDGAAPGTHEPDAAREADVRYAKLLACFHAARRVDAYAPATPTALARAFDVEAEMPESRVRTILTDVLASPAVGAVAAEIARRLGRPLEPHDLWFNGFVPRGAIPEAELDARTRARYPTAAAFAADVPRLLRSLGFPAERADHLAAHILVEPSRGAGHALPAARRGELPRLRTRIEPGGMGYKGYNIAVHELGHNVEQVFSLYHVDHTLLGRVPNTAFTEAFAFVFQSRDLELLGYPAPGPELERFAVLNAFWQTREMAGVALVDIGVWQWMYEHPDAAPADVREATVRIARGVWNEYFAPVLGGPDSVLLGVYSHMVSYPLYLFNYPLGRIIAFQIEAHLRRAGSAGSIGPELERMARLGALLPDVWMRAATGEPVHAGALLLATEQALSLHGRHR